MGAGCGLQRHGVHAGDFGELIFEGLEHFERALNCFFGLLRVNVRKTGQARHVFVNLGVILHGAGAKRVEADIDTVIQP